MFRRVIRIRAEDSPNVQLALLQISKGLEPTNEVLVPGVIDYAEYVKRRKTWDKPRQCVGLDAEFYEGAGVLLFPPERLNDSQARSAELIRTRAKRQAKSMGVDSGEGRANTSWAVVDELGVIELTSKKTANTAQITSVTIALGREYGVPAERWFFDAGGGGRQHADRLREQGYNAQTVAFGASVTPAPQRVQRPVGQRKLDREERYAYVNRRAQMYHKLALLLDAPEDGNIFAIPFDDSETLQELRRQMSVIPISVGNWSMYDSEGRIRMLPKQKRQNDSNELTLTDLVGHSPDELDALVLAVHGLTEKSARPKVSVF